MEYVKTGNAESTYTQRIDEIVRKAHENPIWKREYMDAMIEDIRVEKARYEGARNNALQNARNFLYYQLMPQKKASPVFEVHPNYWTL